MKISSATANLGRVSLDRVSLDRVSLDSEFKLKDGVVLKNRLFKSAMSESLGTREHDPKPDLVVLYRTWADGGVGLMATGNVMIDRTALGEPGNVVLDEKSDLTEFRRWAQAGSSNGAQTWMQLNHPGKQIPNFLCKEPVAPSAVGLERGLEKGFNVPRALTEPEIEEIIAKFALSAGLAKEAGFQGVQIHGAHGYLVSQFLSPRHNRREDRWGGSLENRMRFVLEVYEAIRREVGSDFPVGVKLNSADFMRGGFTEEESMQVVQALAAAGVDLIEISGGTYEKPAMVGSGVRKSTLQREAYFLAYAEEVRKLVDTPLVVTGGFRTGKGMRDALESGAADLVGMARPLALEPGFPNRLLSDPDAAIELRRLTTGNKAIDQMAMFEVTWYVNQIALIGRGKNPKPDMTEWMSLLRTMCEMGVGAFRARRA